MGFFGMSPKGDWGGAAGSGVELDWSPGHDYLTFTVVIEE